MLQKKNNTFGENVNISSSEQYHFWKFSFHSSFFSTGVVVVSVVAALLHHLLELKKRFGQKRVLFMDLGANVGTFSLAALSHGHFLFFFSSFLTITEKVENRKRHF